MSYLYERYRYTIRARLFIHLNAKHAIICFYLLLLCFFNRRKTLILILLVQWYFSFDLNQILNLLIFGDADKSCVWQSKNKMAAKFFKVPSYLDKNLRNVIFGIADYKFRIEFPTGKWWHIIKKCVHYLLESLYSRVFRFPDYESCVDHTKWIKIIR